MSGVADQLEQTADKIEEYNQLAQALEAALAVSSSGSPRLCSASRQMLSRSRWLRPTTTPSTAITGRYEASQKLRTAPPSSARWAWSAGSARSARSPISKFAAQDPLILGSEFGFLPSTLLRGIVPLATMPNVGGPLPPPSIGDVLAPPHSVPFTPPPTVGGGAYTVRPGDSLWTIAADRLGDPLLWTKIAAANPDLTNPSLIDPGQQIHLPTLRVGADCH